MRRLALLLLAGCPPIGATTAPTLTGPTTTPGPVIVEDRIVQDPQPMVDVLFVVQSTPGSAAAQQTLADNFPAFMDYFLGSGLDYHIGFVAADVDDPLHGGKLVGSSGRTWIDDATPDPVTTASEMASIGETSIASQPFGAAYAALELERYGANAGFFRDDATHHVVVVGDGTDATDPADLDPAGFVPWLDGLEADPTHRSLSCLLETGAAGVDCSDASVALGEGEIADLDVFGIEEAAVTAAGYRRAFLLTQAPVPGTIEVQVEDPSGALLAFDEAEYDAAGVLIDGDWTWDPAANAITFLEYIPNGGATVIVTYEAAP